MGSTVITSDDSKIRLSITGNENFIAIGELHNSRSAIKFIIDNIKTLVPNDGRKTYFLTEFLPTDMILAPDSKNEFKYLKCKIKLSQMDRDKLNKDIAQRESDKTANEGKYTLEKLFEILFSLKCELHSIEKQDESSAKLYSDIQKGNLDAFEKRVNQINELAFNKAKTILKGDPKARVIIFGGMGHTANSTIRKFDKSDNKILGEKAFKGINTLLKEAGFNGISVGIHDPELCTDKNLIKEIDDSVEGVTKYEDNDIFVTTDEPDFLLFLNTPSQEGKVIKKGFESIFLPGKPEINLIRDKNFREGFLRRLNNENNIKNHLRRITGENWSVKNDMAFLVIDKSLLIEEAFNHLTTAGKVSQTGKENKVVIKMESIDIDKLKKLPAVKKEGQKTGNVPPRP